MSDKMKIILKSRTQMVECIYKYFDLDLSESHRVTLHIFTLLDPMFKKFNMCQTRKYVFRSHSSTQSGFSCVRLYDMKTDMFRVVQSKVQPQL
jgi:hypothetical protein